MKAALLYRGRNFDPQQALPPHEADLGRDLSLDVVLGAMASEDEFLFEVARRVLVSATGNDLDTVLYRQAVLKDCLENAATVRALYELVVRTIEDRRRHWYGIFSHYPGAVLSGAIGLLQLFMESLRRMREIARKNAGRFESEGFTALFAMLERELADEYLAVVAEQLEELKFRKGVLISAALGGGGEGVDHVLRKPRGDGRWWRRWLRKEPLGYSFRLPERDEAGARALSELRERGIHRVADALAQSADQVLDFYRSLRTELAFYVGGLNLYERLAVLGYPVCFPRPHPAGARSQRARGLYDASLALTLGRGVVSNDFDADRKNLVVVTGANRGGKSSFLRAVGLAQLMMQAGLFVGAQCYEAELCTGLFTHYRREEDAAMKSGKLDEELARMSAIVDSIGPNALVLFNESFAATNPREGSEIARQIVSALLEARVKVFAVTHLYPFACGFAEKNTGDALFLRAERKADGTRTFRLIEGEPRETAYGVDLYRKIFADETEAAVAK